jgi:alkylation response protein AidB-like acyl-CoA dehydrogenase
MASDSGTARAELIAAIRARRAEFTAAGDRAEAERNLPADTMETLRELGAFWLKTPAELGGTPLDPLDFCDVLEEFALTDTATAWAVMVGNGGTGTAGGWLPDAGVPGYSTPAVRGRWWWGHRGRAGRDTQWQAGTWSAASGRSPAAAATPTG